MLRDWEPLDWTEFSAIAADPEVIRYIGDGTPWSGERSREFVQRQIALSAARGFCLWKLMPKEGRRLIGFCGLQPLPETDEIEIGWWLARAWWGRGLATEAARAALHEGFTRAGLDRIVAIAQPANTASIRIMEKLGMRFERMTESRGVPVAMYACDVRQAS
ncbi:MAG TPA: GNAT family N-acetyltransferase [Bryobacteraceae bacterium]|nr:GNAT family N-acetyltransferase [Bryobacteraceae bacterium]